MKVNKVLRAVPATCQYYGQRLSLRFHDMLGRRFGWRTYGNTLSLLINWRYAQYAAYCRQVYRQARPMAADRPSPLVLQGFYHLPGALPEETATHMSEVMSRAIHSGTHIAPGEHNNELMTRITYPLDLLGPQVLDIFTGPLDALLQEHFGSYYLICWLDCYRSYPTTIRKYAWLWHSDNVPRETIKVMLHLTAADEHRGATRFFDWPTSTLLRAKGYFGLKREERVENLQPFAAQHDIRHQPIHFRAAPGDVLVFNNNLIHKAVPPETMYRDVMTFLLMPSPWPWYEVLARLGTRQVQEAPGGFPKNPWQIVHRIQASRAAA